MELSLNIVGRKVYRRVHGWLIRGSIPPSPNNHDLEFVSVDWNLEEVFSVDFGLRIARACSEFASSALIFEVGIESEMPPRPENRRDRIGNPRMGAGQNQLAREIVAALAAANLLQPPRRDNVDSRAIVAMREFSRRNPPQFDGESSDLLVADHWLAQIRKIFNALKITEDDLRVSIVACQLTGEANEWWESVLGVRRDARRAARVANQEVEPVEEKSYREQLRNQFERLDQGDMTVSEYATRFQTLSRFAPELIAIDDRKCRRFEKGLHPSIRKFVVGQRIGRFSDIVECTRSIEYTEEIPEEAKVRESRKQTIDKSVSIETSISQGRKRYREQFPSSSGQYGSGPINFSRTSGESSGLTIVCYRCRQPGHRAVDCPQEREYHGQRPPRVCYRCRHPGHLAVNCPQLTNRGSVQRPTGSGHAPTTE
ncbi:uncharacterized protein LOC131328576 [Rhododendron vialii]|uniref:uncharacterized protein LOC131328576 n=1 Tax=Rhododendron vialii TaxID=182163 RepID=UPI00265DA9F1|nr:uncharacterized protein LOC131328576 [Rhododendron vialii]